MSGLDPEGPARRVAPPTVTGLASITYEPPPAAEDTPPAPAGGGGGSRQMLVIAGVVVALVALLGVGLLLRSGRDDSASVDVPAVETMTETDSTETVTPEPTAEETATPEATVEETATPEVENDPPPGQQVTTAAYTLLIPNGWVRNAKEVDHDAFIESRWHLKGSPEVYALVDYTPGAEVTAAEGARGVRKYYVGNASYRERSFGAIRLNGRSAFRWQFDFKGVTKVDYFLSECDTGYAFLGAAPTERFDDYKDTFSSIARSLEPTC